MSDFIPVALAFLSVFSVWLTDWLDRAAGSASRDPRARDPRWAAVIDEAERRASATLVPHSGRGHCHKVWGRTRQILAVEYGIEWKSPAEMDRGTFYD